MSEAKFTKGKWRCIDGTKIGEQVLFVDATNFDEKSSGDIGVGVICRLTKQVNLHKALTDEDVANANLIAAAPEMYELLKEFIPMDEDGNGSHEYNEGSEYMGEMVNKLLAKARGES